MLIHGDCLEVMRGMDSESVDLIATDPPYNTGRDFGDYDDRYGSGYIEWLRERVVEMRRLLKPTGSLCLQCDNHESHYIKVMMDDVMGRARFRNEVVWKRSKAKNNTKKKMPRYGDRLLVYAKHSGKDTYFSMQHHPFTEEQAAKFDKKDDRGWYKSSDNCAADYRENLHYEYKGYMPNDNGWAVCRKEMERLDSEGRLIFPSSPNGRIRRKTYLHESKGIPIGDIWDDINMVQNPIYETEKPLALLERVINLYCPEGGMVFDPFAGSGTALVAAKNLGRRHIGIDINPEAVDLAKERLREE